MNTYGFWQHTAGSLSLWGDEEWDVIRCESASGTLEVSLPSAETFTGRRYTIRNAGASHAVYVNPDGGSPGETVEGGTGTYTVPASAIVTLQSVHYGGASYGWERVA